MRTILADRLGFRGVFRATFDRPGSRTSAGHEKPMLLFLNVRDTSGVTVTDHLWFDVSKTWAALALQPGDEVQFEARVSTYWKGYRERSMDYKLAFPRHAIVLNRATAVDARQLELFA